MWVSESVQKLLNIYGFGYLIRLNPQVCLEITLNLQLVHISDPGNACNLFFCLVCNSLQVPGLGWASVVI